MWMCRGCSKRWLDAVLEDPNFGFCNHGRRWEQSSPQFLHRILQSTNWQDREDGLSYIMFDNQIIEQFTIHLVAVKIATS